MFVPRGSAGATPVVHLEDDYRFAFGFPLLADLN
jgi:hypothetical protein